MIRINLVGGIGNDLYQYSVCRSIAEKLGYNYYVDCSGENTNYHFGGDKQIHNIIKLFNVDIGRIDGDIKWHFYEGINDRTILTGPTHIDTNTISYAFSTSVFKETINNIFNKIGDFTLLNGFFPNSFYFEDNFDKLLDWFPFKNEDYSILDNYNINEYCFCHFRGGDFISFKNKEQFLTEQYYKNAIRFIPVKKYVIFTNDSKLAEIYFKWMQEDGLEYYIIESKNTLEHLNRDLFTLTRAKYFIGSYSTFSEWTGYLNIDKENSILLYPYCLKEDESVDFIRGLYKCKYFKYITKNDLRYDI